MSINGSIDFSISRELAEKFSKALAMNQETSKEVISRLMEQYVEKTFSPTSYINNEINRKQTIKITKEMTAVAYQYAKKVYFGQITRTEAKLAVSRDSGMNEGSAQDYITDFLAMMEGKEYHRVMSNYGTVYFLENIRKDFGEHAFKRAIIATEKHIKYYNQLGYGQLKEKEKIINEFKKYLST